MESQPSSPEVGDLVDILWTASGQEGRGADDAVMMRAEVVGKKKSSKVKHGSSFKYQLRFPEGEIRETRLLHKQYSVVTASSAKQNNKANKKHKKHKKHEKKTAEDVSRDDHSCQKKRSLDSAGQPGGAKRCRVSSLPSHRFVLAPMVGGSELAFRLLCRRYGTELAYTPMMNSEKFAVDADYRQSIFQTTPEDRPLVCHFSANHPGTLLVAARHVQDQCDAIDLNLGCPQRIAHSGHFGSYLLGPEDRELVLDIVRTVSAGISIPLFVKIRLLDSLDETLALCGQLREAGAALIAIHGRYRVNLVGRSGPGARDGPAHLDQIQTIKQAMPDFPIIANGNIITGEDACDNLKFTGADGVMSAEGILDNPALFHTAATTFHNKTASITSDISSEPPHNLYLALQYLDLVDMHPVPLKSVIFHIRRMCKAAFSDYQLLEDCLVCSSVDEVRSVVQQGVAFLTTGGFVFDPYKEKRRKEMLALKKREEGKRKAYEQRMMRKSKREGRDINYYLNIGAKNPTQEILDRLKALSKEEAFEVWKKDHSQHCYAHHFEDGGCKRDRTCAFLHADVTIAEAVMYG